MTMINNRAEWEKCEEREGGVSVGLNVYTRSYVEGYRGISGAKNAVSPQKSPENPPKSPPPPSAVGEVWGVSQCRSYLSYHNNTPGTPQKIKFKTTPLASTHCRRLGVYVLVWCNSLSVASTGPIFKCRNIESFVATRGSHN